MALFGNSDLFVSDWIETASAVKGDFTFLATPPEREGITKSYCFDIIGAVVIITLAGVCDDYSGFKYIGCL